MSAMGQVPVVLGREVGVAVVHTEGGTVIRWRVRGGDGGDEPRAVMAVVARLLRDAGDTRAADAVERAMALVGNGLAAAPADG